MQSKKARANGHDHGDAVVRTPAWHRHSVRLPGSKAHAQFAEHLQNVTKCNHKIQIQKRGLYLTPYGVFRGWHKILVFVGSGSPAFNSQSSCISPGLFPLSSKKGLTGMAARRSLLLLFALRAFLACLSALAWPTSCHHGLDSSFYPISRDAFLTTSHHHITIAVQPSPPLPSQAPRLIPVAKYTLAVHAAPAPPRFVWMQRTSTPFRAQAGRLLIRFTLV